MPNSHIKAGAVIQYAIIGEDTVIGQNAQIGDRPEKIADKENWGVAVVGHGVSVDDGAVIPPKAMID
jgi:glucose-1-phosphate adenylyltransferase